MLFDKVTPESVGIKSSILKKYIQRLNSHNIPMHSIAIMKGENLVLECYYKPFNKDFLHRMYSQTKSFVSVAIGLLIEDGRLSLKDTIASYFPEKIDTPIDEYLKKLTIRDMLTMSTSGYIDEWFSTEEKDRTRLYFSSPRGNVRPSGTMWSYDSAGSQVLSSLVEKLSGKSLFDYLNERIFTHLGTFKNATILKTRNGDSWGDSAMLCTQRDILSFARFVMNYGQWQGKRLMNREYLVEATSKQVSNQDYIRERVFHQGYGYQFWRTKRNGFALVGMGNQLTICLPEDDIIFSCTADCQGGDDSLREYIVNTFLELVMESIENKPLEENKREERELNELIDNLTLACASGLLDSTFREELNNRVYVCSKNPMGIKEFSFTFTDNTCGQLHYENQQGKKVIPFGVNHNVFGKFPQLGYSNDRGGEKTNDGFMYNDAVSLAWLEEKKLLIHIQIIDRYFGAATMIFGFKDNEASVVMTKCAEDFLNEYCGFAIAKLKES